MASVLSRWPTLADEVGLPVAQMVTGEMLPRFHDLQLDFTDTVAFSYYYRRFFPLLVRYARSLRSWDDMTAQDVVQECFLDFWGEHKALRLHPLQFWRYIRRMVFYRSEHLHRRQSFHASRHPLSLDRVLAPSFDGARRQIADDHSATPMDEVVEQWDLLRHCFAQIPHQPARYRRVFVLIAQGCSSHEIAQALGTDILGVQAVMRQARRRLAKELYQQGHRHEFLEKYIQEHRLCAAQCQQCGVISVLTARGLCAACTQGVGHGDKVCHECHRFALQIRRGLCSACRDRQWKHAGKQSACRQCGQLARLNSHGWCLACLEQQRQQPCRDCGTVGVSMVKGRCRRCDKAIRQRELYARRRQQRATAVMARG